MAARQVRPSPGEVEVVRHRGAGVETATVATRLSRSPTRMPARSAGEPGVTWVVTTPACPLGAGIIATPSQAGLAIGRMIGGGGAPGLGAACALADTARASAPRTMKDERRTASLSHEKATAQKRTNARTKGCGALVASLTKDTARRMGACVDGKPRACDAPSSQAGTLNEGRATSKKRRSDGRKSRRRRRKVERRKRASRAKQSSELRRSRWSPARPAAPG